MGFLAIFGLITQLLPLVAESIKSVQSIIGTAPGAGPVKKETVKTLVNTALTVSPAEQIHSVPPEVLDKVLDKTIDGLVVAMKATGMGFFVLRIPVLATDPGSEWPSLSERLATCDDKTAIAWTSRRCSPSAAESSASGIPT